MDYVRAAIKAGWRGRVRARLMFFFKAHNNFFEEIAKFRAARRLWARIMRERFGAKNPESEAPLPHADRRLHPDGPAAGQQHRAGDPAGPGRGAGRGAKPAHRLHGRGPGHAHPGVGAHRAAYPAGLAYESGVVDTVDPLAGSYFVESLTDEIEERAEAYIDRIEAMGGAVRGGGRGLHPAARSRRPPAGTSRPSKPSGTWW